MPDKLKVHSNERIDLGDYVVGANTYTAESVAFINEKTLLDNRPRVLDGFMVEVSDQAVSPGQITIFNGFAINREGTPVTDESLANSSATITLAGASQHFYVEVEYVETEAASDARAFWDPTVTNSSPIPNGGEVSVNATTRIVPNWRIVQPVSTVGFAITVDPNSTKIPVALLNTDVSNQITNAVNTYGTLVNAATKTEQDTAVGASSVRVLDSKLFAIGSQFTLDLSNTSPETNRTVTANDLDNNIISFTPNLAFVHKAGAIVKQTGVTPRYLPQILNPADPTFTATLTTAQPNDQVLRMWQGNEIRGSAFLASKTVFGTRNDLDITTLKDEIDFLAAVIRDMKWGNPRTDITSTAPPNSFDARPRYFDKAGGIAGARTAYVTIGNGSTTFGDFNGTDQAVFIAAENALPANGGTIYIKPGTYVFTGVWNLTKSRVQIIGDSKLTCIFQNNNATPEISVSASRTLSLKNITFIQGSGSANAITLNNSTLVSDTCVHAGIVVTNSSIVSYLSDFNGLLTTTGLINSVFDSSNFIVGIIGTMSNVSFNDCNFTTANSAISIINTSLNVKLENCKISTSGSVASLDISDLQNLCINNTLIVGTNIGNASIVSLDDVSGNITNTTIAGVLTSTSLGAYGNVVQCTSSPVVFTNVTINATGEYTRGIHSPSGTFNTVISNCTINALIGIGVVSKSSTDGLITIKNNKLVSKASTLDSMGIQITNCATPILIDGNLFQISGTSGGSKYGIYSTNNVSCKITAINNTFDTFSNILSYGVFVNNSNTNGILTVSNNTFTATTTTSGDYTGIYVSDVTTVINGNIFKNVTITGAGSYTAFLPSTVGTVKTLCTGNTFQDIVTATGQVRGVLTTLGNLKGTISFNSFHNIHSNTTTTPITIQGAQNLIIDNNVFNTLATTGTLSNVYITTADGLSITNNTFLSSTQSGVDTSINDTCSNVNISYNNYKSICATNTLISIPVNTAANRNFTINGNKYDCGAISIANHNPIKVLVVHGGASGQFTGLTISNNTICRTEHTTAYGISVLAGGAGGVFFTSDVSIIGNTILETGSLLTFNSPITVTGILAVPMENVVIDGNTINQNATAGDREQLTFSNINRLVFTNNAVRRYTGANSTVKCTNVLGFAINGNVIQSNATFIIFDGSASSSAHGVIIGNTIQNTGAAVQSGFADVTAANNKQW